MIIKTKYVRSALVGLLTTVAMSASALADTYPTLKFIFPAGGGVTNEGQAAVEAALNPILEEAIGAHIDIEAIPFGSFKDRTTMMNVSGEPFDVIFTASWINNYAQNVSAGNFEELSQHFDEVPSLAGLEELMLKGVTVEGGVYGIPGRQLWPYMFGFAVRSDVAEELGIDVTSVESWEGITPLMQAYVDGKGGNGYAVAGPLIVRSAMFAASTVISDNALYAVVKNEDETLQVYNLFGSEEYRSLMRLRREWVDLGLANPDPVTRENARADAVSGVTAFRIDAVQDRPNNRTLNGVEFDVKRLVPLYVSTLTPSVLAVSVDSDHPVEAAKLIGELHRNREIFNIVANGVEGVDWAFQDGSATLITRLNETEYNPGVPWALGNSFLQYQTSQAGIDNINADDATNRNSAAASTLGFTPDLIDIENEIVALSDIIANFQALENGQIENVDAFIDEQIAKMEAAGLDRVLTELQDQLDAWGAN